jgi:hypothetical protein
VARDGLLIRRGDPVRPFVTSTAGTSSGEENWAVALSTSVDSAFPGSHDTASFCWAPVSLLAGLTHTPTATIHSASTIHFDTLPHGNAASRPTPPI